MTTINVEYDPETDTYRTVHDFSDDTSLTTTLVLMLEEIMDDDATLEVLYDVVDPDALDDIFRPRSAVTPYRRGHVAFIVSDHQVTVFSDGVIVIEPLDTDE